MRLPLFADLHLDAPFPWAELEAARQRRRRLRKVLTTIVESATEEADALLCAGDLYEQDYFAPTLASGFESRPSLRSAKVA